MKASERFKELEQMGRDKCSLQDILTAIARHRERAEAEEAAETEAAKDVPPVQIKWNGPSPGDIEGSTRITWLNHALQRTEPSSYVPSFTVHRESSLRSDFASGSVAELGSLGRSTRHAIHHPSVRTD